MSVRTRRVSPVSARLAPLFALLLFAGALFHHTARAAEGEGSDQAWQSKLAVVYVPTPPDVVARMLEMAEVQPDDYVVDLGSGDGRIVVAAARDRGVKKALGVDLDPDRIAEARKNAREAGVDDRVTFEHGDLFEKDFADADVLTIYLLPTINERLRPVILETMTPGTRIVSHAFDMGDWTPDEQDSVDRRDVYLWIVPARVDGTWEMKLPDGDAQLALEQKYQEVSGHASVDGKKVELSDVELKGPEIRFSIDGKRYVGKVDGDSITAVSGEGAVADWSASRS